jgi:cation diffusion facilitator CzcD-associated flavoprotein CzcO
MVAMRPMAVTGLDGTTIAEAWKERIYSYGGIALPSFPNLFMLYGPFAPVNNAPVPLGLDQEIACIIRLIAERRAAVAPTAAATERRCRPRTSVHPDQVGGLILRVGAATRVSGAAETGGSPRSRLPLSPG